MNCAQECVRASSLLHKPLSVETYAVLRRALFPHPAAMLADAMDRMRILVGSLGHVRTAASFFSS